MPRETLSQLEMASELLGRRHLAEVDPLQSREIGSSVAVRAKFESSSDQFWKHACFVLFREPMLLAWRPADSDSGWNPEKLAFEAPATTATTALELTTKAGTKLDTAQGRSQSLRTLAAKRALDSHRRAERPLLVTPSLPRACLSYTALAAESAAARAGPALRDLCSALPTREDWLLAKCPRRSSALHSRAVDLSINAAPQSRVSILARCANTERR